MSDTAGKRRAKRWKDLHAVCSSCPGDLNRKILVFHSITERIHKKFPVMEITDETFDSPFVNLENKNTINPALEFVKSVCEVLALDKDVDEEISRLRTNLLRLIGVREFSECAIWHDPSLSWVLPEVICKGCNHCRDIDLCKDVHRVVINDAIMWQCPVCKAHYDNAVIEYMLIDSLNRKTMAYILQDIQCKKCTQIKLDNVSTYCSCSGHFQTLIASKDIDKYIRTFDTVAKYFKMPLLGQMVDWLKGKNSIC